MGVWIRKENLAGFFSCYSIGGMSHIMRNLFSDRPTGA